MVDFRLLNIRLHRQHIVETLFAHGLYIRVLVVCNPNDGAELYTHECTRVMGDMAQRILGLLDPRFIDLEANQGRNEIIYRRKDAEGKEVGVSKMLFVPMNRLQEVLQAQQAFDLAWVYALNGITPEMQGQIGLRLVGGYNPLFLGHILQPNQRGGNNVVQRKTKFGG